MIVLIVQSVSPSLRGELSKWMLEPQAGVFVGNVSGAVRELLWEKVCQEAGEGNCVLVQNAANEQGYMIRTWGDTKRKIEDWEGLFLVRRPRSSEIINLLNFPDNWEDYLHLGIWAKTPRGAELLPGEGKYHPLICHMVDTAMVALCMWNNVLTKSIKGQIHTKLGLSSSEDTARWIAFFAGLHDLGKASPGFAKKSQELWSKLVVKGFSGLSRQDTVPHQILTSILVEDLFQNVLGLDNDVAQPISRVLGAHHGLFPDAENLKKGKFDIGKGKWPKAQQELLQVLAFILRVNLNELPKGDLRKENNFLMTLSGLCSVADWIASDHDCFPFAGDNVLLPQYPERSKDLAHKALQSLGWLARPNSMDVFDFSELFEKKTPNQLQQQVINIAKDLDGPSLLLLEYPMGGGKTEAALWLADFLACTQDQKGMYFALPTMATSNQMFGRVNEYIANRFHDTSINTILLHGHASLNSEFQLISEGHKAGQQPLNTNDSELASIQAAEWFTYRKRGLLSPYGIGTVDQTLLAILQARHFFVRLFGLAGKVVVIDEIHAYDSYMQVLLERLISWLALSNTSVILLSATLPSGTSRALLNSFTQGRSLPVSNISFAHYPRVSWITGNGVHSQHIEGTVKRSVVLHFLYDEDWIGQLKDAMVEGGCVAVIMNTVGRAQEVYQRLTEHFSSEELNIFHARYPFDIRMEKETVVLNKFSYNSQRPFRSVVVATQVIEQSLDLDFDLIITDLAPIDLLLQRSGRLWRHHRSRPTAFNVPSLWVLMPPVDDKDIPGFDPGSEKVYDSHTLLRTWLQLRYKQSIEIPSEVEQLIENVYGELPPPDDLSEELHELWVETKKSLEKALKKQKFLAKKKCIPRINSEVINMEMEILEEDKEDKHPALQALTRLGGPSVTVVCLEEKRGELWTVGENKHRVSLIKRPSQEELRDLLGSSLRVSFAVSLVKRIMDIEPPQSWMSQVHLRKCRVLRFDSSGECLTNDLPLRLDSELGLYVERERKEE